MQIASWHKSVAVHFRKGTKHEHCGWKGKLVSQFIIVFIVAQFPLNLTEVGHKVLQGRSYLCLSEFLSPSGGDVPACWDQRFESLILVESVGRSPTGPT